MSQIILVIHLVLAIAMIGVVLLQRSEGGGLGIGGGGGGGMSGFLTGRGTANLLTRTTAILAGCFMLTSIALSILAGGSHERRSLIEELPATAPAQQAPSEQAPSGQAPSQQAPTQQGTAQPAPAEPAKPSVPVQ